MDTLDLKYIHLDSLSKVKLYGDDVFRLLVAADEEFVPPLHVRNSTRQHDLSTKAMTMEKKEKNLKSYFTMMAKQSIVIALDGERVVGFLSYKKNAWKRLGLFPEKVHYISTIVVDPEYRGLHIGGGLYETLFRVRGKGAKYMTRTWETNGSHQDILPRYHFGLAKRVHEGRVDSSGIPVATVYYRRPLKEKFITLLRQYQLLDSFTIAVLLFILALVFLALAVIPHFGELLHELFIAVMTSFFASSFAMAAEVMANYRLNKGKEFMNRIENYRIDNIDHDKVRLMREHLAKCRQEVCISGYKLRVTTEMREEFAAPLRRGATAKILLCPPWTMAYKCVYKDDPCMRNFYKTFAEMYEAAGGDASRIQVSLTEEVLFSDTYRFDGTIVTGAFLHDTTAKDFITYVTHDEDSVVFKRTNEEVEKLFREGKRVDVARFLSICEPADDEEQLAEKMKACIIQ